MGIAGGGSRGLIMRRWEGRRIAFGGVAGQPDGRDGGWAKLKRCSWESTTTKGVPLREVVHREELSVTNRPTLSRV